jgi:hypothetical protein
MMGVAVIDAESKNLEARVVPEVEHPDIPIVRWGGAGERHRLIRLGAEADFLALPGIPVTVDENDLLQHRHVLIVGERSGGASLFLRWWRSRLDQRQPPVAWAQVHGNAWLPELIEGSFDSWAARGSLSDGLRETIIESIAELGRQREPGQRAAALQRLDMSCPEPFCLIIRDPEGLGEEAAEKLGIGLRIYAERQRARTLPSPTRLNTLISSTSQRFFLDAAHHSGYIASCHVYRLPWLDAQEIKLLLEWSPSGEPWACVDPAKEEQILEELLRLSGGQPLLIQATRSHLLGMRQQDRDDVHTITEARIRSVARTLRRSPPAITRVWQKELVDLVEDRPNLRQSMSEYVAGKSLSHRRFPPPAQERSLHIAGWLQCNYLGRWSIASKLHAELAARVLIGSEGGGDA